MFCLSIRVFQPKAPNPELDYCARALEREQVSVADPLQPSESKRNNETEGLERRGQVSRLGRFFSSCSNRGRDGAAKRGKKKGWVVRQASEKQMRRDEHWRTTIVTRNWHANGIKSSRKSDAVLDGNAVIGMFVRRFASVLLITIRGFLLFVCYVALLFFERKKIWLVGSRGQSRDSR